MPIVISTSNHPAVDSDQEYLRLNPDRFFRARPYVAGEFGGDPWLTFAAADDFGRLREINTVIVKRFVSFRIRFPISTSVRLDDDRSIVGLLRSRGIDPDTMRPTTKPKRPWFTP